MRTAFLKRMALCAPRASGAGIVVVLAFLATSASADTISANLGAAGPSNWTILTGPNSVVHLNGPGTTNGNVGISNSASNALNLD